ncbi:MAG TPA: hypothetical protein VMC06_01415 [Opitutaceae bacterium]|nr:hypothetical protein [Opitutaceae bacterium]
MLSVLRTLGFWLLRKLGGGVLVAALGLATYGLWLFVQDDFDFGTQKSGLLTVLTGQHTRLLAARGDVEKRIADWRTEATALQQRGQQADRVLAALREESGWWQRLWGNRAQQQSNAERRERMEQLRGAARAREVQLQKQMAVAMHQKEALDRALGQLDWRIQEAQQSESRIVYYLRVAWDHARWYVVAVLAVWFFGPPLRKLGFYHGLAPLIARRRPIRFAGIMAAAPEVGESGGVIEAALWPGEMLRARPGFLQSSDEGLTQKTRFLLDWRLPFTSVACGLVKLVEMRHPHAGGAVRVNFASAENPPTELTLVSVPEGASFILRPSYLVGIIRRANEPLVIRRRWAWWRWPAWVTRQLRFFEFVGPCRLIVGGPRGVRVESLAARDDQTAPVRRTNRGAAIGFTPNLDYRAARTEQFWNYFHNRTTLFDAVFAGAGFFLRQEAVRGRQSKPAGRFWVRAWNVGLKVFGL